ncbi:uncharacterized protein [Pithys albifrons albifrons]|uniref:uncharacterized protein n=1 Tax=Pithys albifrons albifrons TaxID=3385563 RepID=UPI003A5CDF19
MSAGLGPWLLGLALALGPAGVRAQLSLEEAGGGLRAPGQSVRLSCRGSGIALENHYIRWYRQALGGSLEWSWTFCESSFPNTDNFLHPSPSCSVPFCRGAFQGNEIQATRSAVWWPAGNSGTLRCTYSSSASYIYIFWYRQRSGGPLQYLLQCQGRGGSYRHTAPFVHKRFSCQADKSSGTLSITGLKLEDSALYYCSLQGPQQETLGVRLNKINFLPSCPPLLHVHTGHSPCKGAVSETVVPGIKENGVTLCLGALSGKGERGTGETTESEL